MAYTSTYGKKSYGSGKSSASRKSWNQEHVQAVAEKTVEWSKFQTAIFDWVETGTGHAMINAVAGSGKSTVLAEIARRAHGKVFSFAFNVHNVETLRNKMAGRTNVEVFTVHSMGRKILAEHLGNALNLDNGKYRKIVRDLMRGTIDPELEKDQDADNNIFRLCNMARLTLTDASNYGALLDMADHFGIDCFPAYWGLVKQALADGEAAAKYGKVIDFTDMIYLPCRWNLQAPSKLKADWVLLDEAQDLAKAALEIVLKTLGAGARMIAVGDPCQPAGTMVLKQIAPQRGSIAAQIAEVPIETLKAGDKVVAYSGKDGHFYKSAKVTGVTARPYAEDLVVARLADGRESRYTLNHYCVASFAPFRNHYCVYLMRRGSQFRVGISKISIGDEAGTGPVARLLQEGADASWILGFYDTRDEARVWEQAISGKFGIPQLVFNGDSLATDGLVERAWEYVGDNHERGIACLEAFGRDFRYPLFQAGQPWQQSLKRPMKLHAANLMDGCLMLPFNGNLHVEAEQWQTATFRREHYTGLVYSLDVAKYHTYVADGITTHNCQAIMGFAGADSHSFWNIKARLDATELPLSYCYRCGTKMIGLAQTIVPAIEAAPGAIEGEIRYEKEATLPKWLQNGDLVLCRLTAPLMKRAIEEVAAGRPAKVRGKDIGGDMANLVRKIDESVDGDYGRFAEGVEAYRAAKVAKLMRRADTESQIEAIHDKCDAIMACHDGFSAESADELATKIEGIFADDDATIWFSTVHRAKGLEAERVFILKPGKLPLKRANQLAWEWAQELNLYYVAVTRAMKVLTFLAEK